MPGRIPRSSVFLELHALDALAATLLRKAAPSAIPYDYAAMSALGALEGATTTQIADVLGVPLTTASDRLNRLAARGFARRRPNPRDGRSAIFELTEEGRSAAREVAAPFSRLVDRIRERLDVPEEEIFDALAALDRAFRAELRELDPDYAPSP